MHSLPRILLLDHTAVLGGAEFALLRLARHLDSNRFSVRALLFSDGPLAERLAAAGIQVDVLTLSPQVVTVSRYGIGKALLRLGNVLATVLHILRLAWFIRKNKVDVVHTHSLKSHLIGGLASMLAGKPSIWHYHGRLSPDSMPRLLVWIYRNLSGIIPSYLIANSISTLQTLSADRKRLCRVIYPGVEWKEFAEAAAEKDRNQSAPGHRVGIIGRISPIKGQDVFLRASAEVLKRFPDACFQIIGSALFNEVEYEREVRALAQSLGIDHAVEFTGFVSDVPHRLATLDILVLASIVPEPFGQVVVEAMAVGTPVIATDAGGVPEIIEHQRTGLLVPPGDVQQLAEAICTLLGHTDDARQMAHRGQERASKHFTIERTARAVESVYDAVLG